MEPHDIRSLKKYQTKKREAERRADVQDEANYCTLVATLYEKYGQYEEALDEYERALQLSEGLGKQKDIALACRLLGECHCKRGDLDTALRLHQRYLDLAIDEGDKVEQQRALTTIGNTYRSRHEAATSKQKLVELEKAKSAFTESLQLCEELKGSIKAAEYSDMKGRLLYNIGLVFTDLGDVESGISYLNKALAILQSVSLLDVLFLCQRNLSDLYAASGRLPEALKLLEDACHVARRAKDKQQETEALIAKAMVHVQVHEFSTARHLLKKVHSLKKGNQTEETRLLQMYKAVKTYEKQQDLLKSTASTDLVARIPIYEKLGDTAVDLDQFKLALDFYLQQLKASKAAGIPKEAFAAIHVSLAQTYIDRGQCEKAITHYKQEIECRAETDQEQICRSWLNIAANEENIGVSYKSVQNSYVSAYNAAKKAGHRRLQVRSLQALIELFRVNKDDKAQCKAEAQLTHIRSKYNITAADEVEESQPLDDAAGDGSDVEAVNKEEEEVMSELTESDDEEKESLSVRAVRQAGNRKTLIFKRNMVGETPLHKACIKGDLREVKYLISKGHPLNPEDNNGWTPLHEATNNGHLEVTEYLVTHGADINNRGGSGCEGITPLMDAASSGHIEIMELLIKHGANVIAKDNMGLPALHHIQEFYHKYPNPETDLKCRNMIALLKEKMPEYRGSRVPDILSQRVHSALIPTSSSTGSKRERKSTGTRKTGKRSQTEAIHSDSDSSVDSSSREIDASVFDDPDDNDIDQGGAEAYRKAISEVGRSASRSVELSHRKTSDRKKDNRALLSEGEFVGDDWLEDDMKKGVVRKKNMDVNGFLSSTGTRKRNRSDSMSPRSTPAKRLVSTSAQKKRLRVVDSDSDDDFGKGDSVCGVEGVSAVAMDTNDTDGVTVANGNGLCESSTFIDNDLIFDDFDDFIMVDSKNIPPLNSNKNLTNSVDKTVKNKLKKQSKMTDYGSVQHANSGINATHSNLVPNSAITNSTVTNHVQPASGYTQLNSQPVKDKISSVMRLTVHVEDLMLLIPVVDPDCSRTFGWLAQEVADRYYQKRGVKLKLTLGKDGAHFSPSDLVSLMLENNDKIESYLESRDQQPPMTETYKQACADLKIVHYKNVSSLLEASEVSGHLDLSDLALRATRVQPLLKALQHCTTLRNLNISGNRLGDAGLCNLCKVLGTVPNLASLSLGCNDITAEGVSTLVCTITAENSKALQNLLSLDLGHNPLCDGSLPSLAGLISCLPRLHTLVLASCCITVAFFQHNRLQFTEALHKSSLQHLDMSYNQLGCVGIELLLKCQYPTKLLSLDLSATLCDHRSSQMYRHLYNYATQDECAIEELRLRSCHLGTEDADFFTQLPSVAKHLQKLDLSDNPKITSPFLQHLIKSSASDGSSLEDLVAMETGVTAPLSVEFLDAIMEKLASRVPLRRLAFSCIKLEKLDVDSLRQVWCDRYENFAEVSCGDNVVRLNVKDR
ncbi:tonsoku-like protein isoform X2 [Dreissena polymorpha]|uniref:tonsoku-like protein isoform X2 n=1 Tax=Dreissena polymorpha TaxID=45954 RepID=UPI002264431A|nr:tonsoku-like protein isoform X2 [Dreissena polymorpha]